MKTVTIKKEELLKKLIENRNKHRGNFLKAQKGFRQEVIEQLDAALQDARNGKAINTFFELPAPVDQTPNYDTVIQMLNWELKDTVELDNVSFQNYVLDDWHWKQEWLMSNSTYLAREQ